MVIVAAVSRADRSDSVIREAKALAEAFGDSIHVVHVLSTSEFVDLGRTRAENPDAVDMDSVRTVASDIAEEAATPLDGHFEAVGLMGNPAERVVNYANEQDARYIVVGGRRRSPAGKMLFGSVAQSIMLKAECSVLMAT